MATKKPNDSAQFTLTVGPKSREINKSEQYTREAGDKGLLECIRTTTGMRLFKPGPPRDAK